MGSRTIDFWLEFGDEFLVCAIEARWRSPQISTLICGCKNQQNIENQCFCLETQFRTKPCEQSRNGTCVWIRQGSRNRLGKYFPLQKGVIIRENPMEVGRAQIVSTRRFWLPSVHCRLNFLFLLKNTFCPDLWRSRNISHTGP